MITENGKSLTKKKYTVITTEVITRRYIVEACSQEEATIDVSHFQPTTNAVETKHSDEAIEDCYETALVDGKPLLKDGQKIVPYID